MISTLYLVALSSDGLGLRAGWVGRVLGRSDRCLTMSHCVTEKSEDTIVGVLGKLDVSLLGRHEINDESFIHIIDCSSRE